jgi:AAA+ superfamily predicted ATPase
LFVDIFDVISMPDDEFVLRYKVVDVDSEYFLDEAQVVYLNQRELDMNSRGMVDIDLSPLFKCRQISTFKISWNKLTSIDLDPISYNNSLQFLYLDNNRLNQIDLAPLGRCTYLQHLDLNSNKLQRINLDSLQNCTHLRTLDLSFNQLETIDLSPLRYCTSLNTLILSANNITRLDLSPLTHCKSLQVLKLAQVGSNDWLYELDFNPLASCQNLQELILTRRDLSEPIRKLGRWVQSKISSDVPTSTIKKPNNCIKITPLFKCKSLKKLRVHESICLEAVDTYAQQDPKSWPKAIQTKLEQIKFVHIPSTKTEGRRETKEHRTDSKFYKPKKDEVLQEPLEGIRDIDELRELEELDGLEIVEDDTNTVEIQDATREIDSNYKKELELALWRTYRKKLQGALSPYEIEVYEQLDRYKTQIYDIIDRRERGAGYSNKLNNVRQALIKLQPEIDTSCSQEIIDIFNEQARLVNAIVDDTTIETTEPKPKKKRKSGLRTSSQKKSQPKAQRRTTISVLSHADFVAALDSKIVGLEEVKNKLYTLYRKIRTPEFFTEQEVSTPIRVMLYGPPGTGKTGLMKAFHELISDEVSFEDISPGKMTSKYVDGGVEETEKLFEEMKEWGPTIVWMDEFDTLGQVDSSLGQPHYQQRVNSLKRNLDGMADFSHIYLFVGTNYPDKIEAALLSRFQERLEIKLPDLDARRRIIELIANEHGISMTDDVMDEFALLTDDYSGRDLRNILIIAKDLVITRELANETLKPEKRRVTREDIQTAIIQHRNEKE